MIVCRGLLSGVRGLSRGDSLSRLVVRSKVAVKR